MLATGDDNPGHLGSEHLHLVLAVSHGSFKFLTFLMSFLQTPLKLESSLWGSIVLLTSHQVVL